MCCCRGGPGKSEWRLSPQTAAFPLQTGEGGLGEDAEKTLNVPGRKMKAEGTREKTLEGEGGERKGGGLEAICFSLRLKRLTFGSVAPKKQQDKVGTAL